MAKEIRQNRPTTADRRAKLVSTLAVLGARLQHIENEIADGLPYADDAAVSGRLSTLENLADWLRERLDSLQEQIPAL